MSRLSLVLVLVVLLAVAGVAFSLDIKGSSQGMIAAPGDNSVAVGYTLNAWDLPSAYTIYDGDSTEDFYIRRVFNGSAETYWMRIPAGQSILIPAPEPTLSGSYYQHTLQFAGHTDTLYIFPWYE